MHSLMAAGNNTCSMERRRRRQWEGLRAEKKRWRVRQGGEATHRYQEQLTVVYGDVSHTSLQPSFCSFSDAQAGCVSSPSVDAFERSQATREDKHPACTEHIQNSPVFWTIRQEQAAGERLTRRFSCLFKQSVITSAVCFCTKDHF